LAIHSDNSGKQQDVKGFACIKKQYMIRTLYVVSILLFLGGDGYPLHTELEFLKSLWGLGTEEE
jgi:hypothetical protein